MSDSFQILLASSEKLCWIKEQLHEEEERTFQNVGYKQRRIGAEWKINRDSVWRGRGNERRILSFKNNTGFLYCLQPVRFTLHGIVCDSHSVLEVQQKSSRCQAEIQHSANADQSPAQDGSTADAVDCADSEKP